MWKKRITRKSCDLHYLLFLETDAWKIIKLVQFPSIPHVIHSLYSASVVICYGFCFPNWSLKFFRIHVFTS